MTPTSIRNNAHRQSLARRFAPISLFLLAGPLPFASALRADSASSSPSVSHESLESNRRGELIAHIRQQVLEILDEPNGCAVWFQQADPNAADTLRSLRIVGDPSGPSRVTAIRTNRGSLVFKHPWAARVPLQAGKNSTIWINDEGAFFVKESRMDKAGFMVTRVPWHRLIVGDYDGDTDRARITILLHELGHVVGRLPDDDDSWNAQSTRNTDEVLRHCRKEVDSIARKSLHSSN